MSNEYESLSDKKTNLEIVISLAGYGWFSYKLAFLCGMVVTSDAIEVLSVSYILPVATCDMDLNDQKKGWINASIFLGMTIGAIFWGCLADAAGRKSVVIWSLGLNGIFNVASALSKNIYPFIFFRFLSGFGVGGNLPVIYTYNSEFQTTEHRGKLITFVISFWSIGGMIAAGLAWTIIPMNIDWKISENYVLKSWNVFLSMCSIPAMITMCFMMGMPESPRYLLEFSRIKELKKTMRNVFKQNNPSKNADDFEVELSKLDEEFKPVEDVQISRFQAFLTALANFFNLWCQLLDKNIIKTTMLVTIIVNFVSYGYYGMFMWIPELFKRSAENDGSICIGRNKTDLFPIGAFNQTASRSCEVPTSIYLQGFAVVFSKLFGYITIMLCIDKVNRKPILSVFLAITGLCAFLIWFLNNVTQIFVVSCVFGAVASAVWSVIDIIIAESFPTNIRSTAYGFLGGTGRISSAISNVVFGYFLEIYCFLPFLVISGLFWLCSGVTFFIKETKNQVM